MLNSSIDENDNQTKRGGEEASDARLFPSDTIIIINKFSDNSCTLEKSYDTIRDK